MEQDYVVGVDIGGQTAKIGIVNRKGDVIPEKPEERPTVITNEDTDADIFLGKLAEAIKKLIADTGNEGKIKGVGVGIPNGNYYDGTIVNAVNLTWGRGKGEIKVADILSEKAGLPVTLTNDANAAAMGEMTYGAARGVKDFIEIALGTGVGSGIVINGQVVYGNDGFAGELGHTAAVRYNGRKCNCGKTGCLETYASAMGIAKTAKEYLEAGIDKKEFEQISPLREITGQITSKDVCMAAMQGDGLAKKVFDYTGMKLGESFADFVAFSTPKLIVLFGGVTKAGELIREPAERYMNENVLNMWKNKVKIKISELPESDAAILGASALAW